MSRAVVPVLLVVLACCGLGPAGAQPVRRTLNFNMFLLRPNDTRPSQPDHLLLTTDGVSRFGPILEYFIQRVQGMMSVRVPENHQPVPIVPDQPQKSHGVVPFADTAENEIDGFPESRMPGVVVRPSQTKPGTYEVEINVVVDDGQPENKKVNFSTN